MRDYETLLSPLSSISTDSLPCLREEAQLIDYGALIVGREGEACFHVNFMTWHIRRGDVLILFPGDVVRVEGASADFMVEQLRYEASLLREASLQIEHAVYADLKNERCRGGEREIIDIVEGMLHLLKIYFRQDECRCKDQLLLLQLKSFFLGFHDYIIRNRKSGAEEDVTRAAQLFTAFMRQIESDYKDYRDVAHYAARLNISAKYLNIIVKRTSGKTPKEIIDDYVTMHIKLKLRTSPVSIKQIAWEYHFSDDSFFCRHFRQHTGMTPQEYRRKYSQ